MLKRRRAGERKALSNQLTERLTAERTVALQECLAGKPEAALMAVVHALALRVLYRQEFRSDTCLGLEAKIAEPGTFAPSASGSRAGQSLARRHEDWSRKLPTESAELWSWVIGQDTETLLGLLAYCAARNRCGAAILGAPAARVTPIISRSRSASTWPSGGRRRARAISLTCRRRSFSKPCAMASRRKTPIASPVSRRIR